MDFFGIGPGELLLILVLVLIVFGPRRIPEIARTLGKMMREVRKATTDLTTQVTREIEAEEEELKANKKLPPAQQPGAKKAPSAPKLQAKGTPPQPLEKPPESKEAA